MKTSKYRNKTKIEVDKWEVAIGYLGNGKQSNCNSTLLLLRLMLFYQLNYI